MSVEGEGAGTKRLHDAITAAKCGNWDELTGLIFAGDGRVLQDAQINSIPHKRKYGILHQMAWWGSGDTYTALVAKGVKFDLSLRTPDGKTARQLAEERDHQEFAAMLSAAEEPEPEPEPGQLERTTSSELVGDKLRKLSVQQVAALLREDLPRVAGADYPDPDALKTLVHSRCLEHAVDGEKILGIIVANTVPGRTMEDHPVFGQLFDDTEDLFAAASTVVRGAAVFATMIVNKLILANASAAM